MIKTALQLISLIKYQSEEHITYGKQKIKFHTMTKKFNFYGFYIVSVGIF